MIGHFIISGTYSGGDILGGSVLVSCTLKRCCGRLLDVVDEVKRDDSVLSNSQRNGDEDRKVQPQAWGEAGCGTC